MAWMDVAAMSASQEQLLDVLQRKRVRMILGVLTTSVDRQWSNARVAQIVLTHLHQQHQHAVVEPFAHALARQRAALLGHTFAVIPETPYGVPCKINKPELSNWLRESGGLGSHATVGYTATENINIHRVFGSARNSRICINKRLRPPCTY